LNRNFLISSGAFTPQQTLAKWRIEGGGPPFTKVGRMVVYDIRDLRAFVDARKPRSTSDRAFANVRPVGLRERTKE
jgi:hypothetical protein